MGDQDEIRIYDRILSETEWCAVMADQSTGPNSMAAAEAHEPTVLFASEAVRLCTAPAGAAPVSREHTVSISPVAAIKTRNRSQTIGFEFAAAIVVDTVDSGLSWR